MKLLGLIAACFVAWVLAAVVLAEYAYGGLLAPAAKCGHSMLCYHNHARGQVGARPLRLHAKLERSSALKARMVARCGFSHTACGRPMTYVFRQVGYGSGTWLGGENLAWAYRVSIRDTFRMWLRSRSHRANILRRGWRHLGVSRRRAGGRTYRVAHFGRP